MGVATKAKEICSSAWFGRGSVMAFLIRAKFRQHNMICSFTTSHRLSRLASHYYLLPPLSLQSSQRTPLQSALPLPQTTPLGSCKKR